MVNKDVYGYNGKFNNLLGLITTIPTLTIINFSSRCALAFNHKAQ